MPDAPPPIPRTIVLGVGISAVTFEQTLDHFERLILSSDPAYVTVTGVHGVMESQRDQGLLDIHNCSALTVPDGMPMVWASHHAGAHWVERVYGPDLMLGVCARSVEFGWKHFLYGGGDGVVELLAKRLTLRYPGIQITGMFTPPFRPLTRLEDSMVVDQINSSEADIIWIGLSTPKQEHWMAGHVSRLERGVMVGVGAAFDFHAGLTPQAPRWMQQRGLEWLYRLGSEPTRLWKRYLRNNPEFVLKIAQHPPTLRYDLPFAQ